MYRKAYHRMIFVVRMCFSLSRIVYSYEGIGSEIAVTINVNQSAIVLITEDRMEGSFTAEPTDIIQAACAQYWSKQAIIY
jgi:hypothetical protein